MQVRMIGEPVGVVQVCTRWKRQQAKMLPRRDQGPLPFFDSYSYTLNSCNYLPEDMAHPTGSLSALL